MIEQMQPRRVTRIHLIEPDGVDRWRANNRKCPQCGNAGAPHRLDARIVNQRRIVEKTCLCGHTFEVLP